MTPQWLADAITDAVAPSGVILEPCAGDGAFVRSLSRYGTVGTCEAKLGEDFLFWTQKVDWVVTDLLWSVFRAFLSHALPLADHVVFFGDGQSLVDETAGTGREECGLSACIWWLLLTPWPEEFFPASGFQLGAMHLERGWHCPSTITHISAPRSVTPDMWRARTQGQAQAQGQVQAQAQRQRQPIGTATATEPAPDTEQVQGTGTGTGTGAGVRSVDMTKHLRPYLIVSALEAMGGEYEGVVEAVTEELIRNRFTGQKTFEPVISFVDGKRIVLNATMLRQCIEWFGADSNGWIDCRLRLFLRRVESVNKYRRSTRAAPSRAALR